jgi:signal transduction histidine kinase
LLDYRIIGAQLLPNGFKLGNPDGILSALLRARLGSSARPRAAQVAPSGCFPWPFDVSNRAAGADPHLLDCWAVEFIDAHGVPRQLAFDLPPLHVPPSSTRDPIYLLGILVASATLSFAAAQIVTGPLRRLTQAARAFSLSINPEPIPEIGPTEVRTALATFNVMQNRIRNGFRERTQILAAIAHDLQTPLTRLRLRLEQVESPDLRKKLISDLGTMQALVRDGLDLARSSESREPWSLVDIDSLLSSLCEDAAEFGGNVRFVMGCGKRVRLKPNAVTRCVSNIIDNALKYGGDADVECVAGHGFLEIRIRDHGPGIDEKLLPTLFEPFVRREGGSSGGTGIGLTIARAQAQTFGGSVSIANHPEGGAIARIQILAEV